MSCRPPKPPVPCECGCGAMLAQPRNGGPRRFASDSHARLRSRQVESERVEQRDVDNLKRRERYRQKLAGTAGQV